MVMWGHVCVLVIGLSVENARAVRVSCMVSLSSSPRAWYASESAFHTVMM